MLAASREAGRVAKWYGSLAYLVPVAGGFLADRWLGNRRAVTIGTLLMAFDGTTALLVALCFLVAGMGFFNGNISTQVGRLYPATTPAGTGPLRSSM